MLLNYKNIVDVIAKSKPMAQSIIRGSAKYPKISGKVNFYATQSGVVVVSEVMGLPKTNTNVFGFHIHEGKSCTGNQTDPFANAGLHYNPLHMPHPMHAGDLPPLFSNNGYAWQAVLTNRFQIPEIIGRAIVIHDNPDDFTTQPAGNSGNKIACGIVTINKKP